MDTVSPWVAFLGGLLSLFTPCVLPLLPVYLGSLCGPDILASKGHRLNIFLHSLSFTAGFSLVFVLLGTLAGLIGFTFSTHIASVRWISGGLMIAFGLFMLAALKIGWLNYEKRLPFKYVATRSFLRSFVIGMIFTVAWTPCVGPILGGILTLAFNSESVWQGSYLLLFYSAGMALPFLILGLTFDFISPLLKRIGRFSNIIYIIGGLVLIGVGVLILLDKLNWFSY